MEREGKTYTSEDLQEIRIPDRKEVLGLVTRVASLAHNVTRLYDYVYVREWADYDDLARDMAASDLHTYSSTLEEVLPVLRLLGQDNVFNDICGQLPPQIVEELTDRMRRDSSGSQ